MGRISAETHLGERMTALETKIEPMKESISSLRSATDPIPKMQGDFSMLKVPTAALVLQSIAIQESLRRMEDMMYRQFGENHRPVTRRFSENSFRNSSRGVDRDQDEHSDKRLKIQLFRGDDPFGWLFLADRFFALNGIEEGEKIYVASQYLLGPALKWFIGIDAHTPFPSWKAFRSAVLQRFGRVIPIDNSAGVPGRDRDEESGGKSGKVREYSPLVSALVRIEVVAEEVERLKMTGGDSDKVLADSSLVCDVGVDVDEDEVGRVHMSNMGWAWKSDQLGYNNFGFPEKPFRYEAQSESPITLGAQTCILGVAGQIAKKLHSAPTATPTAIVQGAVMSFVDAFRLSDANLRPKRHLYVHQWHVLHKLQLTGKIDIPISIPWLWKRRKKHVIAAILHLEFEKKFSNWIFHKFKEKKTR